jgi:hypothetical protein
VSCWMAPRDVKPGTVYADVIVRAINEAKALVLVLSGSAPASSHVGREVERAASKHKPNVGFRIDTAVLNPGFEYFPSESQWINVPSLGMPATLAKLAEAVRQGRTAMKDMFERLRLDPGSRTLGQLIQERRWVTSRDPVVKQRIFDYNEDDCIAMRDLLDTMRTIPVRSD